MMNRKNIPRYLKACLRAVVRNSPRVYLKMLSRSPYTVTHLDTYGIEMIVDVRDPAISKPILALGEYEKNFAERLLSHVTPDTCFVDVGANIGFFSLAVGRRATNGRVWSIEPDPRNVRLLRASIALNGFEDRVDVRHVAASDTDGELFFSTLGYEANLGARFTARDESTLLARSVNGAPSPTKVRAQAVDNIVGDMRVDLVKVDVEGYEPAVLKGMHKVLAMHRPVVFSEFAPGTIRHISKTDPSEMLDFMKACGYLVSIVEDNGSLTPMTTDVKGVLARHDTRRHHLDLLFTPKESANQPPKGIAHSARALG